MTDLFRDTDIYLSKLFYKISGVFFALPLKINLPEKEFYGGLIGCGEFVKYAYIPALNKLDSSITISSIYSRTAGNAKEASKRFRYKSIIFDSFKEFMDSNIKAVIVTSPNHLHYEHVKEAIGHGMDVLCEKPLCNDLDDILSLKTILDRSNSVLMVEFPLRYSSLLKGLSFLLRSRAIGDVETVEMFYKQSVGESFLKSDWKNDSARSGGGVVHNAAIHLINVVLHLFGDVENVCSTLQNRYLPVSFGEDTAHCEFIFKSGMRGTLNASYIVGGRDFSSQLLIRGTEGNLKCVFWENDISIERTAKKPYTVFHSNEIVPDVISIGIEHFYNCIKLRTKPMTDIEDSIRTMRVIKAIYTSHAEGGKICIDTSS